jgi:hypothetical protein
MCDKEEISEERKVGGVGVLIRRPASVVIRAARFWANQRLLPISS